MNTGATFRRITLLCAASALLAQPKHALSVTGEAEAQAVPKQVVLSPGVEPRDKAVLAGALGPQFNGSFESVSGGLLKGWTTLRGAAAADRRHAREGRTALRLESPDGSDACMQSPPVSLRIGQRYELSAWVRAERLRVRDLDRSPIAVGAAVSMASAPFDVHSESLGGTRDWTRVRLRFTATRAQDHILLAAGLGGQLRGRAWFDSVSLEEVSSTPDWPAPAALETLGPAYRYPTGGWIYVHIQGTPYERGYQHGRLLAREIEQYINRCALNLDAKSKEPAWEMGRTTANALFLRGFDREILEEMKGIADGAASAGAKWANRDIDLVDILTVNTIIELMVLRGALSVTPTGLEGLHLERPAYAQPPASSPPVTQRCSAFAATGPATRDGRMIIGHITMAGLSLSEQTNVLLDIQPTTGRRLLMQSFPGGIQSGTDYYQNDAGMVLTETTIRQTPFNIRGTPVSFRARKAIQYGTDIDKVLEHLGRDNNGLYTNEWLIGDAKNNEIAMFELGTNRTKLYRSSRDEWFGGTEGFYWGCNNTKDLGVRLEYLPDPKGPPAHVPFVPSARDLKWQELYRQFKGKIDEQFAFLAFRTAPLVTASSFDAKVATADMASHLMCWAVFGKPNQREWAPGQWGRQNLPHLTGIYSAGYRLIQPLPEGRGSEAPAPLQQKPAEAAKKQSYKDRRWEGWILPTLDSELWLSAGSSAYYWVLGAEDWERQLEAHRARFLAAASEGDQPLRSLTSDLTTARWYLLAAHKGALLFDALRRGLGDDRFFSLMKDFFAAHTARIATSQAFLAAVDKAAGKSMQSFFSTWLDNKGLPGDTGKTACLIDLLPERLRSALLVYGTVQEAGANRYAAEQFQRRFLDWFESEVPIRKDFETSQEDLQFHDIIFVGRPETNSALAAWKDRLGLNYQAAVFRVDGLEHASEKEALLLAAPNPLDRARMVLVVAGNSALETVRLASASLEGSEYAVYRDGQRTASGFQK